MLAVLLIATTGIIVGDRHISADELAQGATALHQRGKPCTSITGIARQRGGIYRVRCSSGHHYRVRLNDDGSPSLIE